MGMRTRFRIGATAVLAAIVVSGCQGLKDVMALYTALDQRFHQPMNVNLNNDSHLVITLVNAPERELDDAGREDYAREIAAFARSRWPHRAQLDDITVAYSSVSKKGVVTYTSTTASYRWRLDELPAPAAGDTAGPAPEASAPASGTAKKD
jgi:hypothetical protein